MSEHPNRCHTGGVQDGPFGDPAAWPQQDLIAVSEEFDAALTVEAYAAGVFPMPLEPDLIGWWSPMARATFLPGSLKVSRSLRKQSKRYVTTVDAAFDAVLAQCADPDRDGSWIDERIARVYAELHRAGIAHSVETWDAEGNLVGGLYGIRLGGLFAGESMFHDPVRGRDASKTALMRLVVELEQVGGVLLDTQWLTPHLASLGATEISREDYLSRLKDALTLPMGRCGAQVPMTGGELVDKLRR